MISASCPTKRSSSPLRITSVVLIQMPGEREFAHATTSHFRHIKLTIAPARTGVPQIRSQAAPDFSSIMRVHFRTGHGRKLIHDHHRWLACREQIDRMVKEARNS